MPTRIAARRCACVARWPRTARRAGTWWCRSRCATRGADAKSRWGTSPRIPKVATKARSSCPRARRSATMTSSRGRLATRDAVAGARDERKSMSASFVPFLFELRAHKVKVGAQEAMALAKALTLGLHDSSLDGFYHVARALCVHRESDLDAFDQAFAHHFRGIESVGLDLIKELEQWLSDPRAQRELSDEERALLQS